MLNKKLSPRDKKWQQLNQKLQEAMKRGDFQEMSIIYFELALQAHKEGKPSFPIQKACQEMLLRYYRKIGYTKKVEISVPTEECDACKSQAKKIFSLDEALKKMPLPAKCKLKLNKKAPDGWCVCSYLPVIDVE